MMLFWRSVINGGLAVMDSSAAAAAITRPGYTAPEPFFRSDAGTLFEGDCTGILPALADDLADTIFADPPFNLGKIYGKRSDDSKQAADYVEWCHRWLADCTRILKPGGALFLYNLPKWNFLLGAFLTGDLGLQFRHAVAIEMKSSLPIAGRLYPAHYSLLYLTKGKPKIFRKIRTPIELCRHCGGEIRDYGGHRHAMNPAGVNLKDVWTDIPPVRHRKFKSKNRQANALSTKILDRVVEMTTLPGDLVLDPFGGSGTTFAVCERKQRRWIGIELDFCDTIVERLTGDEIKHHRNDDVIEIGDWPDAAE
jgi:site-specific DNA-methyltransferase (adenine-specific)